MPDFQAQGLPARRRPRARLLHTQFAHQFVMGIAGCFAHVRWCLRLDARLIVVAPFCALSGSAQACYVPRGVAAYMFQRTELIFRGEVTAYLNGPRSLTRFRILETYRGPARAEWWLLMPFGAG